MTRPAIPLKEFDHEMTSTRKLLERVPSDEGAWKPHPKSFPLGHLAQLVASMPGWIASSLRQPDIDLAGFGGYSLQPTEGLVRQFDENVRAAREALETVTGAALDEPWSLKHGAKVLYTSRRGDVVREHLSHLIHHRGQLTVYVRMVDAPVPSIYGPSADEGW